MPTMGPPLPMGEPLLDVTVLLPSPAGPPVLVLPKPEPEVLPEEGSLDAPDWPLLVVPAPELWPLPPKLDPLLLPKLDPLLPPKLDPLLPPKLDPLLPPKLDPPAPLFCPVLLNPEPVWPWAPFAPVPPIG